MIKFLAPFVALSGLSRGGEWSKAEAVAHATEAPADPNVCHMLMAGDDEFDELDSDELDGDDVLGDDVLGMELVGAVGAAKAKKIKKAIQKSTMRKVARAKPRWRNHLAPGVPVPDYGVFPVPLTPLTNGGVFTAAVANIVYQTVIQVPFRGERLLIDIARTGGAGTQILAQNGVFVGIRPQTGVLGNLNLANYQRDSFGVRFVMQPAEQGAELKMFVFTNPVLTGTDTIAVSVEILGRVAS
jgi:hypothetical protein